LGVPLIALPVFITAFAAVFFGLGKITAPVKTEEVFVETPATTYPMSRAGTLAKIGETLEITYYLIVTSGEAIELIAPLNIDLSKLVNKRILASGSYDSIRNVLTVDKVTDLEILPLSPSMVPTIPVTPTPTELST
jgi:hypothetical protein